MNCVHSYETDKQTLWTVCNVQSRLLLPLYVYNDKYIYLYQFMGDTWGSHLK